MANLHVVEASEHPETDSSIRQNEQTIQYNFVDPDGFTPNSGESWINVGSVVSFVQKDNVINFKVHNAVQNERQGPILYFLTDNMFRLRFHPNPNYDYEKTLNNSYAVVDGTTPTVSPSVNDSGDVISITTDSLTIEINKSEFTLKVIKDGNIIHQDQPGQGLLYIPNQDVIANMKVYPAGANYFGFGEKAGPNLNKTNATMTFFNYDNFRYSGEPFNYQEALYNSTPFLIEANPKPDQGSAYFYGLLFDNPAQTYFNLGNNENPDNGDMYGKYYFGSLYGELNYYFFAGNNIQDIVSQYTTLTGRTPLPPKYALGYHQGCYGYFDRWKLEQMALLYRKNNFPIDGLHIDVDFQDNYRTFTHSELKFPNPQDMFATLKGWGFKCATNITALITRNPLDERCPVEADGNVKKDLTGYTPAQYPARDSGIKQDVFIKNLFVGNSGSQEYFVGGENYGDNNGYNPYPYPPIERSAHDVEPLASNGYYPDFGKTGVQAWWGEQYKTLIDIGLEMVWQDMMVPALAVASEANTTDLNITYDFNQKDLEGSVETYENSLIGLPAAPNKTMPLNLLVTSFDEQVPNAFVHNAYGTLEAQGTYQGLTKIYKENFDAGHCSGLKAPKRPFIIARGGYAGVHRYAGLWTGDSASTWEFLQINIPEVVNMGLSGITIAGCDIGGFANGSTSATQQGFNVTDGITDYKLLTRWMQAGAFLPWFRNHYDGYTKAFQEPIQYDQYSDSVRNNTRKYVQLRYRLIQVFYDAMYHYTKTGVPIVRPLFMNNPTDTNLYDDNLVTDTFDYNYTNTQFFLGDNILVAPFLTPDDCRPFYLPQLENVGDEPQIQGWYPFNDNTQPLESLALPGEYKNASGEYAQYYDPDLSRVPLFVKAGAIIPVRALENWIGESHSNDQDNPITFNFYPNNGGDYTSSYILYEDDNESIAYQDSEASAYRITEINAVRKNNKLTLNFKRTSDNFEPREKYFYLAILGQENAPSSITINGQPYSTSGNAAHMNPADHDAWYYNQSLNTIYVKIFVSSTFNTLVIDA